MILKIFKLSNSTYEYMLEPNFSGVKLRIRRWFLSLLITYLDSFSSHLDTRWK